MFDQPQVVAPVVVSQELAGRLTLQGGDFFSAVPGGADAYRLKPIIHDWTDEACLRILGQIRAVMAPDARVGRSGLRLQRIVPTPAPVSVVERRSPERARAACPLLRSDRRAATQP